MLKTASPAGRSGQAGFTLLELMIALAILGIIVAVALPGYRESIRKSNRTDAHITMSRLVTLQERYYFRQNQYTGDFADLISGLAANTDTVTSDEGHYSIRLTGGGTDWTMAATAIGGQADDTLCATLTLTSRGVKTAVDGGGNASSGCW